MKDFSSRDRTKSKFHSTRHFSIWRQLNSWILWSVSSISFSHYNIANNLERDSNYYCPIKLNPAMGRCTIRGTHPHSKIFIFVKKVFVIPPSSVKKCFIVNLWMLHRFPSYVGHHASHRIYEFRTLHPNEQQNTAQPWPRVLVTNFPITQGS